MEKLLETLNTRCLAALRAARFTLSLCAIILAGWVLVVGALEGTRALRGARQEALFNWLEYELGHYDTRLEDGKLKSTADLTNPLELKRELLTAVVRLSTCRDSLKEINNISE